MMPFFDNFILVLALKLLEISLSMIFRSHLSNPLKFVPRNQKTWKNPSQFVGNYMDP